MSCLVVLQQWFGELPNGQQVEKDSFQIILEGPVVTERRGPNETRIFVGFVSKTPGERILYQPVIDVFRDLVPEIEVQIGIGLINWHKGRIAAAQQLVDSAKAVVDSATDETSKAYAEAGLKSAEESLARLRAEANLDQQPRPATVPTPEDVEAFRHSVREEAEAQKQAAEGTDESADQQNL